MKKNFKYIFLLTAILFCHSTSIAQSGKLDSLFDVLKIAKDTQKVNVLDLLAKEYEDNDVDIAFQYSLQALALAEKINFKKGVAKSSNIIGSIYEMQNKPAKAREHFLYALKTQTELNDKKGIAAATLNAGITYAEQSDFDTGRKYMLQALDINKEIRDTVGIANALMNLGGTYDIEKNWPKALDYYDQSLKLGTATGNKAGITKCLTNIGYVYYAELDNRNAEKYLLMSNDIASETHNSITLRTNYEILADIYLKEKQFEKAYQYHTLFTKLKDSLSKESNVKQLQELEEKYEAGKKQKKIELLNKERETQELLSQEENKRKNTIIIFVIIGLFVTIVFIALLFNRFRTIQKQKLIIEEKNKEVMDSIKYAKRIQNSLLPTEKYIDKSINRLKKNKE